MESVKCFYCKCENPTLIVPVKIYDETYFKGFDSKWVCKNCYESEKK